MKIDWWQHLKEEDKKAERKALVLQYRLAYAIAKEVIDKKLEIAMVNQSGKKDYESPSWPYIQADYNGYIRCLREMSELLTIEEK